ncbi:MAG TPA: sigma-54 dependent transcriptional regulator [Gemmataceae bacterium]|nr:sigma-54 dependent transcriptional regulator [Gemmataceae bacterium]
MPKLLVIDDEPAVGYSFQRAFAPAGVEVVTARTGAAGVERFRADPPDAVVLDVRLPDRGGLEVYRDLRAIDPRRPVVVITAHGTTETAIEATKEGAFEYLLKPVDFARMKDVLNRAFAAARLQPAPAVLPGEAAPDRIVGRSRAVAEMCKLIGRTAPQDVHVLILGESGTGKELVARAAVNCAAVADGDPVPADARPGGTLFLDEAGDLTPAAQGKLLSHLQGPDGIRVLAATSADLDALVAAGRFRKDLYYRLRGVTVRVPPLRERGSDVAELANHFLFQFNREMGLDFRGFAPEVLELFEAYPWPGNVRELQGAVRQAMLAGPGHLILPDALPSELRDRPTPAVHPPASLADLDALIADALAAAPGDAYTHVLRAVEARLFPAALARTNGNQVQASELLGLHRATLRHKLRSLGINVEKTVAKPD